VVVALLNSGRGERGITGEPRSGAEREGERCAPAKPRLLRCADHRDISRDGVRALSKWREEFVERTANKETGRPLSCSSAGGSLFLLHSIEFSGLPWLPAASLPKEEGSNGATRASTSFFFFSSLFRRSR
jgi:hypothetical protein